MKVKSEDEEEYKEEVRSKISAKPSISSVPDRASIFDLLKLCVLPKDLEKKTDTLNVIIFRPGRFRLSFRILFVDFEPNFYKRRYADSYNNNNNKVYVGRGALCS